MSTVKEQLRQLAEALPDDATWELVRYEVHVRARLAAEAEALARRPPVPDDEVEQVPHTESIV